MNIFFRALFSLFLPGVLIASFVAVFALLEKIIMFVGPLRFFLGIIWAVMAWAIFAILGFFNERPRN